MNTTSITEDQNCQNTPTPNNDDVCDATLLTVNAPCATYSNENAFSQSGEPGCTFGLVNSVWFKFVAPASGSTQVQLSEVTNGLDVSNARIGIYTATDCNDFGTFSLLACDYNVSASLNLNPGTTYYVQIDGYENNTGAFCIAVISAPPFFYPECANNDACDALFIPVGATCTSYQYTNECADGQPGEPNCTSSEVNSVWFKFIAPQSGRVRVSAKSPGGTLSDGSTRIGIYEVTDCHDFGTFNQLSCEFGNSDNLEVPPGQTYYIQIDGYLSQVGTFCLEIEDCPAPINDHVCDAVFLNVGAPCSEHPYTNACATGEVGEPNCTSGEVNSLWFKFIAPPSGRVRVSAKSPGGTLSNGNTRLGVYAVSDCNDFNSFNQINCEFGNTDNLEVTPGKTYYIQVDGHLSHVGTFCIEIEDCPSPINDDVCDAILVTVGGSCLEYPYTNACANGEAGEPNCTSGEVNSVWFKFIAPPSGRVKVSAKTPGGTLSAGNTRLGVYAVSDCNDFNSFNQINCEFGNSDNLEVISGQTYYVQVDGHLSHVGNFCIEIEDCPSPINDNVCDAILITVDENCSGYQYSNVCANGEVGEPNCTSGEVNSVWFKFVAPPSGMATVRAKPPGGALTSGNTRIGVYSVTDCSDFNTFNQINCEFGETDGLIVIPGQTYYIQVDGHISSAGTFCMEVYQTTPPSSTICSNDDICNAIPLTFGEECSFTTNECASFQTNEPYPSCFFGNSTNEFNSVWFSFVAPSTGRISIADYGSLNIQMALYTISDCNDLSTATEIFCDRDEYRYVEGLTPGQTYYLQVDGHLDYKGDICIRIDECTATPSNDDVCDAIPLTLGSDCVFTTNTCASYQAEEPFPSCFHGNSTYELNSVWFSFVAPSTGRLSITEYGNLNIQMALYTIPDCNDLSTATEIFCDRDEYRYVEGLTPGQTYFLQIDGQFDEKGDICISIDECSSAPANDDVCNAIPLTLGNSCVFTTNTCASFQADEPFPSCFYGNSTYELNSVWFSFVAPSTGRISITDYGDLNIQMALYSIPDCNDLSNATEIFCDRDEYRYVEGLTPGQTYFLQIDGQFDDQGEICIGIDECSSTPSNDDVCNAISLTLGSGCVFTTNTCAAFQADEPFPSCFYGNSTYELNSVWFSFVAPPLGQVDITDYGDLNIQMALYTIPDCNDFSTATEVFCDRDEYNLIEGLTPGQTYYIQIDGQFDDQGGICLSVVDPNAPDCPNELILGGVEDDIITHQATIRIESVQQLYPSSVVQYFAAEEIILNPGFDCNGELTVLIEECQTSSNITNIVENPEDESQKKDVKKVGAIPLIAQPPVDKK